MESDFVAYSVSDKSDYPYRKFAIDLVDHYAFGLAGVPTQEVSESSEKFWEKALDGEIKDYQVLGFAKELTRLMSILGRTIAITGSPIESIRPLQRHLGISEAAGTILHIDSGRFTGSVVRNTALDVQKQKVVAEYLDHSINTKLSFAFGDSVHDLPLLEAVGNPFVLGDNAHLRQIGRDRNWTVITQQDEVLSLVNDRLRSLTS
jgi:phosphoserine phosphatase